MIEKSSSQKIKEFEDRNQESAIYNCAIETGKDFVEAVGYLPTLDHLDFLYKKKLVDYSSEDFLLIFHDEDDLQSILKAEYDDEQSRKRAVLNEIHDAITSGELPAELSHRIVKQSSRQHGEGKKKPDIGVLIAQEEATADQQIGRYAKFLIVQSLAPSIDSEERRLGIALGLNLASKKLHAGFSGEVCKANSKLSTADVELAALTASSQGLDFYDYVYPATRNIKLEKIRRAIKEYKPGGNTSDEYFYNISKKQMVQNESSIQRYFEVHGYYPKYVYKLGQLLVGKEAEVVEEFEGIKLNFSARNPYKYKEWNKLDYLRYGKWLLRVLEPLDEVITERILIRAQRLNLGPGWEEIASPKKFGSLKKYYKELGMDRKKKGSFSHWTFDDYVSWGKIVASENDGKFSTGIIEERGKINRIGDEPTLKIVKTNVPGGVSALIEAMGSPPNRKRYDLEDCITAGVNFVSRYDRYPDKNDLKDSPELPGITAIYNHCGSIPGFRSLIKERIDQWVNHSKVNDDEGELLAA